MAKKQVCPWCDTEIVWDEEFGPEETCPHCENELSDYKSVTYGVDDLEEPTIEDYGELTGAYSDEAVRGSECSYCGEETLVIGQRVMRETEFIPRKSAETNRSLLEAPFTMDVSMCPSCLQMSFSLSDESRKKMEERWKREIE